MSFRGVLHRSTWRLCLGVNCALLTFAFPTSADEGDPLSVTWTGPDECPANLQASTEKLLGDFAKAAGVQVNATAVQLPDETYRVNLQLSGNVSGARSLESARCDEAIQAAAVVLALAINPDALLNPQPSPPEEPTENPKPAEPATPEKIAEPEQVALAEETPAPRWNPYVQMNARVSGGLVPGPAWGASLSGGLERQWWRFGVHAFVAPDSEKTIEPQGATSFVAWGGGVDACVRPAKIQALSIRLCPGLSVASIKASPTGLEGETTQRALLYVPRLLGALGLRLHPHVAVVASGGVQVPTTSVNFEVDAGTSSNSVHRVGAGPLGRLGVEFLF